MASQHVSSRIPQEHFEAIEDMQEIERIDRSTAIARLLERGINEWRVDHAIELYRSGTISVGRAAEKADISIWEFLDILDERDVLTTYDEDELERDLASLAIE